MPKATPLPVTEEQALYFRARRGHLAGPGAADPETAARAVLGAQAQQPNPGMLALSLRTAGRPEAAAIERRLLEPPRTLVRTWGQRDTLHIYDSVEEWATVVAARPEWGQTGRRRLMPPRRAVAATAALLAAGRETVTRSDLLHLVPTDYVEQWQQVAGSFDNAQRWAAGRLVWKLAQSGDMCVAGKIGAEQAYAARTAWFPDLAWPARPEPAATAATRLARRYLAVYGPATAADLAHFFGAPVGKARSWLETLGPELVPIHCGERAELWALAEDVDDLRTAPPDGFRGWPLRLLPTWDTMMMGHADKSWTVPEADERPRVWRAAAFVAATVVVRGRVVATWTQKPRRRELAVAVEPLSGWRAAHAPGVRREARAVAAHLGLRGARVSVAS